MLDIINKATIIKLNPTTKKESDLENKFSLKSTISELTTQAENYIKENEYYSRIDVGGQINDPRYYAKGIAFSIQKDTSASNRHMLRVSMLHPSMRVENSKPLAYGSKEEIIKFLKDKDSIKEIETKLNKLSYELKNN